MTDTPDVIAEANGFELRSNGVLDQIEGTRGPMYADILALMADLYRRVREEIQEANRMHRDANVDLGGELTERIEVSDERHEQASMNQHDRTDRLEKRIEALEIERTEGIEVLADRLAAVEVSLANEEAHCDDHREAIDSLDGRMAAVGARVSSPENRVAADESAFREDVRALFYDVSALEARQQGEAGEGAGRAAAQATLGRYTPPGQVTDDYVLALREEVRRETAREIADFIRQKTSAYSIPTGISLRAFGSILADDVEREFGGE